MKLNKNEFYNMYCVNVPFYFYTRLDFMSEMIKKKTQMSSQKTLMFY